MTKTLGEQIYEYVYNENGKGNYPSMDEINEHFSKDVSSNVKGMILSEKDNAKFKRNSGNFVKGEPRLYLREDKDGYEAY